MAVCLLVVCSRLVPGFPLVVASNRDEELARPARPLGVLAEGPPAVLGGRDERAGGTWLAVNEAGVLAGLTNRPSAQGRDPTRRSRGELPLLLTAHTTADEAVAAVVEAVDPRQYNAAWLLVGDRTSLHYLELDGAAIGWRALPPGVHILENRPLEPVSEKAARARRLLGAAEALAEDELVERLIGVLGDHETTEGVRPACIHGERYGTRSSSIVLVPEADAPITVLAADGRPCATPFTDETWQWPTR